MGSIKLNFDGCTLGDPNQRGIRGVIMDHHGIVLRVLGGVGLAIDAKILALLEGLLQAKALDLSNILVEGDSAIVISRLSKLERGPWKCNIWLDQIPNIVSSFDCSFSWSSHSSNEIQKGFDSKVLKTK